MGFSLGRLLNKANLKEAGLAAGGGAVAGAVFDLVADVDMTDSAGVKTPVFDKAWKKAALAAGLTIVGGGVLWKWRPAAHGAMGAMGAELGRMAIATLRGAVAGAGGATGASLLQFPQYVNGNRLAEGTTVRTLDPQERAVRAFGM